MEADGLTIGIFYSGAGVFLVLLGIFFLVRYGSPSGDEGMARESNRVQEIKSESSRAQGSGRRAQKHPGKEKDNRTRNRTNQEEWLKKQKEELKFQKDSLEKAVDKDLSRETGSSHVTVKPGPRRPRGRR